MKKTCVRILPPLLAAALIAFAADVSVDYNHHADFSKYHTYSWLGVHANGLWQDRIMSAVDSQLAARGWQKVPSGGDATVSALGRVTERDTLETYYDGFPGWGWRGWGGMGTATTTAVPERIGGLTVDIFDSGNKQLIWRGQASDVISSKPEKNEKKMDEAVEKLFKAFPPQGRG
ncbi:MAG TPA: DUF4136 domain-containing protein [Candidatus Acidoferrales bacterium]|nr:DUF4136 domain-containing protein [Candidatus Acidoferrales bacterium]